MTVLFADTFYWIALADFADSAHRQALVLTSERASSPIVTTDEVLAEYLSFFSNAPGLLRRAVAESVQTMRREGLTEVLTNDRHFEQEGFRALFRNVGV